MISIYTIVIEHYMDDDGELHTDVTAIDPDEQQIPLITALGLLEQAKAMLLEKEDDDG